ncbi:hypothetical protein SESBI_34169 [Sesbania bispinosa]|nr:hypothetical protein SESBI_34169 [Sesbania bispinosa]
MEKSDVTKPITTTLNGSNYNFWVPGMKSFLIGRKFWRIVTRDIRKPTKAKDETNEKFVERLEEWDSKNHQIITWFRNTSIPSIQVQFTDYNSAKEIWDFLANRCRIHKRNRFLGLVEGWVANLTFNLSIFLKHVCLRLLSLPLLTNGICDLAMPQLAKYNL